MSPCELGYGTINIAIVIIVSYIYLVCLSCPFLIPLDFILSSFFQMDYRDKKLEDTKQNTLAGPVTEQVEYTPLHPPIHGRLSMSPVLPRTESVESTEGRYLPNLVHRGPASTGSPSPEKSPTLRMGPLERSGSYTEVSSSKL